MAKVSATIIQKFISKTLSKLAYIHLSHKLTVQQDHKPRTKAFQFPPYIVVHCVGTAGHICTQKALR